MRRSTVNILRRTCVRNGDNLFAASRRRTSASAISRFTRLLSCPCGRLSRHLFGFFFPVEKSMSLFLFRLLGRSALSLGLWFLCGFHLKNKLRSHIVMQLDRDLMLAGVFNWAFQNNFVSINFRAELIFDAVHNILRGDWPKCLSCLAGLQCEDEPRLTDSAREFFCLVQLAGFALGALLLQSVDLTQRTWSDFVCFPVRQEIIARITTTHLDYVRLGTQTGNVFSQNKFSQRHIDFQ